MGRNRKRKAEGLGDSIEMFTDATGIKKAVEVVSNVLGVDCGCNERKDYLNKKFSYRNKIVNCPTEQMKEEYANFVQNRTIDILNNSGKAENEEVNMIERIYAHVKGFSNYKICRTCPNAGKEVIKCVEFLDEVFNVNE